MHGSDGCGEPADVAPGCVLYRILPSCVEADPPEEMTGMRDDPRQVGNMGKQAGHRAGRRDERSRRRKGHVCVYAQASRCTGWRSIRFDPSRSEVEREGLHMAPLIPRRWGLGLLRSQVGGSAGSRRRWADLGRWPVLVSAGDREGASDSLLPSAAAGRWSGSCLLWLATQPGPLG